MTKIRVGVLMGGRSIEKEVSFNSGRTICDHLDTSSYDVVPIFQTTENQLFILPWRFLYRGKIADFEHRLTKEAQSIIWDVLPSIIDFMYIATHGRYAEDGTLQGFLEILGIPYLGSKVFSSALGMDKIRQKEFLRLNNISVPQDVIVYPNDIAKKKDWLLNKLKQNDISFPVIIKPYKEGSSLGMSVVDIPQDLQKAVHEACTIHPGMMQPVLIEEKVQGMEFTCITITDHNTGELKAFPPTEIIIEQGSHFFDYDQKYMPGRATKYTPARCSKKNLQRIQDECINVMRILEMENLSRIDGFLTKDNTIVIIDPNTLSGMAPSSFLFRQAAESGMGHTQLINHLIETELCNYGIIKHKESKQIKEVAMESKKRIAVIMGGRSNEKEISLESGRNITYKLSPQKYNVIPLFLNKDMKLFQLTEQLLVRHSTQEIEDCLNNTDQLLWNDLPSIADFVFLGLHGGEGENGSIQGTLETLDIPYNGSSVLTSALCMDKFKTNTFLKSKGFDVPQGYLITKEEWNTHKQAIFSQFPSLPIIVKPHDDGCSVMVQKITQTENLEGALNAIFKTKNTALVEECIEGMELTVGVIGNETPQALPPSRAVSQNDILSIEEKFLPGAGENQTPAPLPSSALTFVQKTMEDVYSALGCQGYVRIDCFYQSSKQSPTKKERVIIIEINTLPGMTPATALFHQAAEIGIKPMDFIDMIVQFGFEAHNNTASLLSNHKRLDKKESA